MERYDAEARDGWQTKIEQQGLIYWKTEMPDGSTMPYWHETSYYSLTATEVYELEATARLLMEMLIEAGDYIIDNNLFGRMGIPAWAIPRIKETWESEPPMIYGRFDFSYGPAGAKVLEYNADTPTSLIETAVQWHWMQDVFGAAGDQWNRIHEALVERWHELKPRLPGDRVHFFHTAQEKSGEDFMTIAYLVQTAREAEINCDLLPIESLHFHKNAGFLDSDTKAVRTAFKLYPWEWMVHEEFARPMLERMGDRHGQTIWIEPIWKMLWSNKGILAVLWRLFPGHDALLPAFFEDERPAQMRNYVRKPLLAREGANTTVVIDGDVKESGPDQGYGGEGYIVQEYTDLGETAPGVRPVLGVWTVEMEPQGLGIREQDGLVTNNLSRFVPHVIEGV